MFPQLPPGFRFGTSTAAYQIEGAAAEDGKGPNVWDTFCADLARVADGSDGAVACDHYHRWQQDVELLAKLGVDSYRFSISWSRVQPAGSGPANPKGLAFYDRLIDRLLEAGVAPMATLYHWDLPQSLEDDGGWLNRATIDRFAEYAALVGDRFADRVEDWVPLHEPAVVTMVGHAVGQHPPGRTMLFDALPVAHHLLLAHGRAAIELRRAGATSVGCANLHSPIWPASDSDADVGAAKLFDAVWNGLYLEGMLLGRYPADVLPLLEDAIRPGDLATIRQPLDFYGVDYYTPRKIAAAAADAPLPFEMLEPLGLEMTDIGWPVVPDALREWLITFRARYRAALPPIVITGSGCAYGIGPDGAGRIDDQLRIDYLDSHLRAVATAIDRGVDVRGFYVRSLLDTFEWNLGFGPRFGLVHVDQETLVRTPKKSFGWFADLISAQHASQKG